MALVIGSIAFLLPSVGCKGLGVGAWSIYQTQRRTLWREGYLRRVVILGKDTTSYREEQGNK